MRALIVGGSAAHPGGIESFVENAGRAVAGRGEWSIESMPANTAYLRVRDIPGLLRSVASLRRWKRSGVDVVWIQYGNLPDLLFVVAGRALGHKVMVTPHLGNNWRSQRNGGLRMLSSIALRAAHRLALISPTQEDEIALPAAVPRSYIRNFVPQETLELPEPVAASDTTLRLLHSGRLSPGKGTHLLLEVCAGLQSSGVDFQARITGSADTDFARELRDRIQSAGLHSSVSLLGRVTDEDLRDHLLWADVLVHLSTIDSYPLIVLEALSSGTFPLAIDLAGVSDMVSEYDGRVVPEEGAVVAATEFLRSAELSSVRQRGVAASERVRADYAWDRCGEALQAALAATAAGHRDVTTKPTSVGKG